MAANVSAKNVITKKDRLSGLNLFQGFGNAWLVCIASPNHWGVNGGFSIVFFYFPFKKGRIECSLRPNQSTNQKSEAL